MHGPVIYFGPRWFCFPGGGGILHAWTYHLMGKGVPDLGGVESLIEHRATIEGDSSPVPKNLLRLSVGAEHVEDLLQDLLDALDVT